MWPCAYPTGGKDGVRDVHLRSAPVAEVFVGFAGLEVVMAAELNKDYIEDSERKIARLIAEVARLTGGAT